MKTEFLWGRPAFHSGESRLVVLRDPAVLVDDHVGPSMRARCVKSAGSSGCCEHGPGSASCGSSTLAAVSNLAEPHRYVKHTEIGGYWGRETARCFWGQASCCGAFGERPPLRAVRACTVTAENLRCINICILVLVASPAHLLLALHLWSTVLGNWEGPGSQRNRLPGSRVD